MSQYYLILNNIAVAFSLFKAEAERLQAKHPGSEIYEYVSAERFFREKCATMSDRAN